MFARIRSDIKVLWSFSVYAGLNDPTNWIWVYPVSIVSGAHRISSGIGPWFGFKASRFASWMISPMRPDAILPGGGSTKGRRSVIRSDIITRQNEL